MVLPDVFIDHDKPEKMYEPAGLNAAQIVATVLATLGRECGGLPRSAPERVSRDYPQNILAFVHGINVRAALRRSVSGLCTGRP